jgi:hypothetical protein
MIPRLMSFYWSGPLSWLHFMTLETFRRWNPDWEMRVYSAPRTCTRDACSATKCGACQYDGEDYSDQIDLLSIVRRAWSPPRLGLVPAQACDLCEWHLLSQDGGFYSDMDILWLRSLDPLRERLGGAGAAFCLEGGMMAVGFMAAGRNSTLFRDVYELCLRGSSRQEYQQYGSSAFYRMFRESRTKRDVGPGAYVIERLRERYRDDVIVVLPDETVYPYDWREVSRIFERRETVSAESYGLHWFGGHPIARRWNRELRNDNWFRYESTLTDCLSRVTMVGDRP